MLIFCTKSRLKYAYMLISIVLYSSTANVFFCFRMLFERAFECYSNTHSNVIRKRSILFQNLFDCQKENTKERNTKHIGRHLENANVVFNF